MYQIAPGYIRWRLGRNLIKHNKCCLWRNKSLNPVNTFQCRFHWEGAGEGRQRHLSHGEWKVAWRQLAELEVDRNKRVKSPVLVQIGCFRLNTLKLHACSTQQHRRSLQSAPIPDPTECEIWSQAPLLFWVAVLNNIQQNCLLHRDWTFTFWVYNAILGWLETCT